jgi:hypothetical protein
MLGSGEPVSRHSSPSELGQLRKFRRRYSDRPLSGSRTGVDRQFSAARQAEITARYLTLVAKVTRVDDHSPRYRKTETGMAEGTLGTPSEVACE